MSNAPSEDRTWQTNAKWIREGYWIQFVNRNDITVRRFLPIATVDRRDRHVIFISKHEADFMPVRALLHDQILYKQLYPSVPEHSG